MAAVDDVSPATLSVAAPNVGTMKVPTKLLLGPGPSNAHPRVLSAMASPVAGHMTGEFYSVMDDIQELLRYAFQTTNPVTLAVSGSGHCAMEAAVLNVVEPGTVFLVGNNGLWGKRVASLGNRIGADVREIQLEPGQAFSLSDIEAGLKKHRPSVLFLTHGDSSVGVLQPMAGVGALCHRYNCMLVVDTVCSLGGVPLFVDAWEIDVAYSGSQKCLGCPTGASPITFSPRAIDFCTRRKSPVGSFYLDILKISEYWGVGVGEMKGKRAYHHTGLTNNFYALRESLVMLAEEGLPATWLRHRRVYEFFRRQLSSLGLTMFVPNPNHRLPTVNLVNIPAGVDWMAVIKIMYEQHGIQVSGGLAPLTGKVWRIGLMGINCTESNVVAMLHALKQTLHSVGHAIPRSKL